MPLHLNPMSFCLVVFCLLSGHTIQTRAQDDTTAASPKMCNESISMALDVNKFTGIWWEVAREPANTYFCTEVNITIDVSGEALIAITYSNTPDYAWVNQTMNTTLQVQNMTTSNDGYNISYINPPTTTAHTVYKILDTDYDNYAFVCGYTNATDNATSFGLILTRDRLPTTDALNGLESNSSALYSNFLNGSMSLITQSTCAFSSGSTPMFNLIYAALAYLVVRFYNN